MGICAEILVEIDKCGFKYKNKLLQTLMSCSFAQKWISLQCREIGIYGTMQELSFSW